VGCNDFFYPLDAVGEWNRAYGRRGVLQYQCVIPEEGARAGLVALLETLTASGFGSFLTVLKTLGAESEGLLSFPMPGKTLALDIPHTGPDLIDVLRRLDAIVLGHGGRTYLAKDACMTKETFERMYPRHAEFRAAKAILDPSSRFSSSLARRLGLTEESP
jgi:FAD/FMN-containing dehydrogenase